MLSAEMWTDRIMENIDNLFGIFITSSTIFKEYVEECAYLDTKNGAEQLIKYIARYFPIPSFYYVNPHLRINKNRKMQDNHGNHANK